ANYDFNFNDNFAARFDFGWNDISGDETHFVDSLGQIHIHHPNMSIWEFTGGFKTGVSILYIEGRGGYFTGLNEWGFVPAAGLRFGSFDIQGSYTIAGDNEWATARLGFAW
ncbi:MAG: hypothetical protein KAH54_06065, partial [Candidatus Sabulitectum sp.]|nr:hypothetical protein [Candidatus Sabulitectum sp.]